jgi:hypothetical protein
MADKKISQLPSITGPLTGSEEVAIVQGGVTKKGTVQDIVNAAVPYKVYRALLTQSGTDAPVATVLENTLGDIVWSYLQQGDYTGTLSGAFTANKTFFPIPFILGNDNGFGSAACAYGVIKRNDINEIRINTIDTPIDQNNINGILNNSSIEILVYP